MSNTELPHNINTHHTQGGVVAETTEMNCESVYSMCMCAQERCLAVLKCACVCVLMCPCEMPLPHNQGL